MSNLIQPMSIDDRGMGFIIERQYADCSRNQLIREYAQNGFEAIAKSGGTGLVIWDFDHAFYELLGVMKLCCIDTGCGMDGETMLILLNQLSSSGAEQSLDGNFGLGAKIAAIPINPLGIIYRSWINGRGYMITIVKENDGSYGAVRNPSTGEFWFDITDDPNPIHAKPKEIEDHGTKVTFMGQSQEHETFFGFDQYSREPKNWLSKYMGMRYYQMPDGITVKCREGSSDDSNPTDSRHLRTIHGQRKWNDASCEKRGIKDLPCSECRVHWWILKEKTKDRKGDGHSAIETGHVAAVLNGELTDVVTGPANRGRQKDFGIAFSSSRLVMYAEPYAANAVFNGARSEVRITNALGNTDSFPWRDVADDFQGEMPEEIRAIEDQMQDKASDKRSGLVRDILRKLKSLYKFSRYKVTPNGTVPVDPDSSVGGVTTGSDNTGSGSSSSTGKGKGKRGNAGDILKTLGMDGSQEMGEQVDSLLEPEFIWVGEGEAIPREPDYLVDRAAEYMSNRNIMKVNADFRVFRDMHRLLLNDTGETSNTPDPGTSRLVWNEIKTWVEVQLTEVVVSVYALKATGGRWSKQESEVFFGEDALTAAVLPRLALYHKIRQTLGRKVTLGDSTE